MLDSVWKKALLALCIVLLVAFNLKQYVFDAEESPTDLAIIANQSQNSGNSNIGASDIVDKAAYIFYRDGAEGEVVRDIFVTGSNEVKPEAVLVKNEKVSPAFPEKNAEDNAKTIDKLDVIAITKQGSSKMALVRFNGELKQVQLGMPIDDRYRISNIENGKVYLERYGRQKDSR